MSDKAITIRLRQTEQLRKLSLSLMKAKLITDDEAEELRKRIREKKLANSELKPNPILQNEAG